MFYPNRAQVITPGTPVPLTTTRTMCAWVEIVADTSNKGLVYVGGRNTTRGTGAPFTYEGIPLYPKVWLLMREMGGPNCYDLQYIYVDADNANDSVSFVYGRS